MSGFKTLVLGVVAGAAATILVAGIAESFRPASAAESDTSLPMIRFLTWGNWQKKVGFAQAASVQNPGRLLFLSGVGAEEEMEGTVQHIGDFTAQCNDAWGSIKKMLEREGGSLQNIVRIVTYVTDPRDLAKNNVCKKAAFGDGPYPPHTFLNVSQLAIPGMLIEVEVTAALPK